MKDYVIVGASGFGREIRGLVNRINKIENKHNFLGYIGKSEELNHPTVIGDNDFLVRYNKPLDVVIAIANPYIRKKIVELYKKNCNLSFPNIIDLDAVIMENLQLGEGNIICAGNIITVDVNIGNFNIINLGCTIGHEAIIGDYVVLNPNTNISGNAVINDRVNIGTGTQVLQGRRIGRDSVIGAGAVVTVDIPDKCTAVGVPAKVIKENNNGD